MRVLHINCNYITTALHQNLIRKLRESNINSTICVPVCDYDIKNSVITPDSDAIVLKCFNRIDRIVFQYKQKKIYKAINNIVKNSINDYDLIHAYTLFTDGNVAMNLWKKYDVPYLVTIRDTDMNAFFKYMYHLRRRGLEILINAKIIFFLSESYRELLFNKYIPEKYREELYEKTVIIPNGIDDYWIENRYRNKECLDNINVTRVLAVGKLCKRKNMEVVAKAIELLNSRGRNIVLTIVGKNVNQKIYKNIMRYNFIRYYPQMEKENLINIYRKNDIFALPSLTETFGLVYAEAMSQGLPIIYSKGQGFDKQFPDGLVGFSVDARSPEELAEAILKIEDNYKSISNNCISCSDKFNWGSIAEKYIKVYKKIVYQREIDRILRL